MTDITTDTVAGVADEPELEHAYTSESTAPVAGEAVRRPSASAPGAATGRRKQAIARVRIVPGTGEWQINGRTLEAYFPNKVHQQIVGEPFTVLDLTGAYDVLVRVHGGGPSGQAGARPPRRRPGAQRRRRGAEPSRAQEGRVPHPRRARPRAQEGRPQEGPQGSAVQQALTRSCSNARAVPVCLGPPSRRSRFVRRPVPLG